MRIVIDCFKLVKGSGKSIGIYNLALHLVKELARTKKASEEIIVLGTEKNRADFGIEGVKFISIKKYNPLNKLECILWELFLVSKALYKIKADAVVFPRGYASVNHVCKDYVIIHDMIPFYYAKNYPDVFSKFENFYIMWRLKASAKSVHGVITISESSKQDILQIAKISEQKVHVVYNGLNEVISKVDDKASRYISAVTSSLPHKNAEKLLKSYLLYYKKSSNPMDLYIAGLSEEQVLEKLLEYGCDDAKKVMQHIHATKFYEKDEDLQKMIAGSSMFVFTSRKEGFGFPPLEAMQMGVPVVCSNSSSLSEVVGDAGILVDPEDEEAIANAMVMMEDVEVAREYIQKGYENVKRFTWKNQIEEYRKVWS